MPLLEVPGFEADDVLGTLVDRVRDSPVDVVLVTADKDMLQLVGPRVRVFTTTGRGGERVVLDEAAVKVKMGVSPEQIPDLLALMGDSIDNIPGVPGVGEKTAAKLIGQFGSVERLYENLHLVPGKLREVLATHSSAHPRGMMPPMSLALSPSARTARRTAYLGLSNRFAICRLASSG
jgi:DNA polymerase-1